MNQIFIAAIAFFLAIANFFITATVLRLPTNTKYKQLQALVTAPTEKKKQSAWDWLTNKIAEPLSHVFPFSKARLDNTAILLKNANIAISPNLYLSRIVAQSVLLALVLLLCSIVFRPFVILALFLPVLVYFLEVQKEGKSLGEYRKELEEGLPDFVSVLAVQLSAGRDVLRILTEYSRTAPAILKRELEITVSDMNTGSYERALDRFAARINSPSLNKVIFGLKGSLLGNNQATYFQILSYELQQEKFTRAKKRAQRNIPKLNFCSFLLLAGVLILYIGVLLVDVVINMGTLL